VRTIVRSPARCSLVTGEPEAEVWSYELPSLFLRSRLEASAADDAAAPADRSLGTAPDGTLAEQWTAAPERAETGEETPFHVALHGRFRVQLRLPGSGWTAGQPVVSADWLAAPVYGTDESRVYLFHAETGRLRAEVLLARAGRLSLRLTPSYLTISDDRGRVLVLDLEYGQIRRDLRL